MRRVITLERLLNEIIIKTLPPLYATDGVPLEDKIVICRFYMPSRSNGWEWYVFEGERLETYEREIDGCLIANDYRFFGMVHGFEKEMGYFLLSEITDLRDRKTGDLLVQCDPDIFMEPYRQLIE